MTFNKARKFLLKRRPEYARFIIREASDKQIWAMYYKEKGNENER